VLTVTGAGIRRIASFGDPALVTLSGSGRTCQQQSDA
jgi:hypothetical protein